MPGDRAYEKALLEGRLVQEIPGLQVSGVVLLINLAMMWVCKTLMVTG